VSDFDTNIDYLNPRSYENVFDILNPKVIDLENYEVFFVKKFGIDLVVLE